MGYGGSQHRAWGILEELIRSVVVCFCPSLSGTSFTDIPVYCWQLLLKIKLYFHYQADLSVVIEDLWCA